MDVGCCEAGGSSRSSASSATIRPCSRVSSSMKGQYNNHGYFATRSAIQCAHLARAQRASHIPSSSSGWRTGYRALRSLSSSALRHSKPRCASIIAAVSIEPMGLAIFFSRDWRGKAPSHAPAQTSRCVRDEYFPLAAMPRPPCKGGSEISDDVAEHVVGDDDIERAGIAHHLQTRARRRTCAAPGCRKYSFCHLL